MTAARQCTKCGTQVSDLLRIDAGMRLRIQEVTGETAPEEVCANCFRNYTSGISKGAKLRAEEHAREQNKLMLWRSRVNLVKQGRSLMGRKAYSEAAVQFEKYLRVLEVVYDKKPGDLAPELFKDSARTKEITVVASVLWDLVRIYDTSPRYGDRQKKACDKLVQFLQFTPIQSEIVRKARTFEGTAKNSGLIRSFIKNADKGGSKCFIATVAFEDPMAPEVLLLRQFRDVILLSSLPGQIFVKLYYFFSPGISRWLWKTPSLRRALRSPLRNFALWLARTFNLQNSA